jgi:P-type Ca2+ transporter type 2C
VNLQLGQEGRAEPPAAITTPRSWHALSLDEVTTALDAGPEGLDEAEVIRRREQYGPNLLPEGPRRTVLVTFLHQFKDPLIYILLVAAVVSLVTGHYSDSAFIFAVLLVNAVIGTIQEQKAEESARALQQIVRISVAVRRSGREETVDSIDLVPGDVVLLSAGHAVPADLRLWRVDGLKVDESLLTGESMPVKKRPEDHIDELTPVGDRVGMAFAGTTVAEGRAIGYVCETGAGTELGQIAESLATGVAEEPPLVIRMRRMSRLIGLFVLAAIAVLGAVYYAQGNPPVQIFFLAVALAVAAIPEGLPVAITVALAVASRRMATRKVIVRRLPAVEGLGACTLIASDKTGTLTANELTIKRIRIPGEEDVEVAGSGVQVEGLLLRAGEKLDPAADDRLVRLARAGALCNEGRLEVRNGGIEADGDEVDVAFLVLAAKLGLTRQDLLAEHQEVATIPYEPYLKYAAAYHRADGGVKVFVKGAAEEVVTMCGGVDREQIKREEAQLAGQGYRVLAVAEGRVAGDGGPDPEHLRDLEFLGLVGVIDPIREAVPDAIASCRSAGVEVRMITGDHPATGLAIARQLGMADSDDEVITGAELTRLAGDEDGLREGIARARVYARVAPRQKTEIVTALQQAGHFVAVTGDGVNDAPALRAAHIGVAMGRSGTDVARGAADLILTDDNFASIVNGIEEGRVAYDNVRKVTWLLVSTGAAEIVLFFLALITQLPLPLTAIQLLWLNLVTNGIQHVALAFEGREPGVVGRPPRPPEQGVFDGRMVAQLALSGAYMGAVAFAAFYLLHITQGLSEFEARNYLLLLMVLFENAHVMNCRSETESVFRVPPSRNWLLIAAIVVAQVVHLAAMFVPGLREVLDVEPVSLRGWLELLPVALSIIVLMEVYKWFLRRRG